MVDAETGTMRLRGVFSNPDRILQPGFFARVRVPGSAKYSALLIPDDAVGANQDQKYVMVANAQNIAEIRPVTVGPIMDGMRVVRSGLQTNDWVLITGLMTARPGAPIAPTPATNSVAMAGATAGVNN